MGRDKKESVSGVAIITTYPSDAQLSPTAATSLLPPNHPTDRLLHRCYARRNSPWHHFGETGTMKFGDDIDTFKDFAVAFGAFLGEIEWHGCSLIYSQFLQSRCAQLCSLQQQKDLWSSSSAVLDLTLRCIRNSYGNKLLSINSPTLTNKHRVTLWLVVKRKKVIM